jgi:hypothetical protein
MNLMEYADQQGSHFPVGWMHDGLSFIIRNESEFIRLVVPKFFKEGLKFSSFKRKLHRWGFRVVMRVKNQSNPNSIIIFRNDHFQRDAIELIKHMRSITPAAGRKPTPCDDDKNDLSIRDSKSILDEILESSKNASRPDVVASSTEVLQPTTSSSVPSPLMIPVHEITPVTSVSVEDESSSQGLKRSHSLLSLSGCNDLNLFEDSHFAALLKDIDPTPLDLMFMNEAPNFDKHDLEMEPNMDPMVFFQ